MDISDAEPIAGILAVRRLERAAREFVHGYIRQARKDGHIWHEIAPRSIWARAPPTAASPSPRPHTMIWPLTLTASTPATTDTFAWTCPAGRATVTIRDGAADRPPTTRAAITAARG
jgi:hypothetical protein